MKIGRVNTKDRGYELHLFIPYKKTKTQTMIKRYLDFPTFLNVYTGKQPGFVQIDLCVLGFGFSFSTNKR